tara:strand:+ start:3607 stop:4050 length:444 start_codon:yes stop_codon:yes gene_type:complete
MSQNFSFEDCRAYHISKGWSDIGYHFYIEKSGTIHKGRPLNCNGAHVRGFNNGTIGICTEGGLDEQGAPKDTMNDLQRLSVEGLLLALKEGNPSMKVKGHRDYSPDLNGNGKIEPFEFSKACPCYDAQIKFGIFNSTLENVLVRMGR